MTVFYRCGLSNIQQFEGVATSVAGLPSPIASFKSNVSGVNLSALKVLVEAVQDLHGYDKPWAGGGGKNIVPLTISNIKNANKSGTWVNNVYTHNGVAFSIETDEAENVIGIKANGTASGGSSILRLGNFELSGNTYAINGLSHEGSQSTFRIILTNSSYSTAFSVVTLVSDSLYQASERTYGLQIVISNGIQMSNEMFYPMVRLSSISDSTFAPYENICPITGWSGANVTVNDGQTPPIIENVYTIAFGDTYYGGELDVTNGVLRVTHGITDLGDLNNWTYVSSGNRWTNSAIRDTIKKPASDSSTIDCKCNQLDYKSLTALRNSANDSLIAVGDSGILSVRYTTATAETINSLLSGVMFVYELATPIEIQLTPTQIAQLLGDNNVFADCGDVEEVKKIQISQIGG